jgi:hypothetical protein
MKALLAFNSLNWEILVHRFNLVTHVFSPTHKRTEGLAPEWGSELTKKNATLNGDSADFAARLNVKIRDLTSD